MTKQELLEKFLRSSLDEPEVIFISIKSDDDKDEENNL